MCVWMCVWGGGLQSSTNVYTINIVYYMVWRVFNKLDKNRRRYSWGLWKTIEMVRKIIILRNNNVERGVELEIKTNLTLGVVSFHENDNIFFHCEGGKAILQDEIGIHSSTFFKIQLYGYDIGLCMSYPESTVHVAKMNENSIHK